MEQEKLGWPLNRLESTKLHFSDDVNAPNPRTIDRQHSGKTFFSYVYFFLLFNYWLHELGENVNKIPFMIHFFFGLFLHDKKTFTRNFLIRFDKILR